MSYGAPQNAPLTNNWSARVAEQVKCLIVVSCRRGDRKTARSLFQWLRPKVEQLHYIYIFFGDEVMLQGTIPGRKVGIESESTC